jgi:hypothetical protein
LQKILLICVKASLFLAIIKVTKSGFYNMISRHEILISREKKAFERPTGKKIATAVAFSVLFAWLVF